jgi:hypothetical protein
MEATATAMPARSVLAMTVRELGIFNALRTLACKAKQLADADRGSTNEQVGRRQ